MKALLLAPMGSVHRRFNKANIDALIELGYTVELCANLENGDGPEIYNQRYVNECESKGIKTHSIPFTRHSLTGSLKCLPQLKKLLKTEQYDVVHTHTETGGLLLKLAAGVKGKAKYFYTPHGMSFWKGSSLKSQMLYKPLERWICSAMDMCLGMNKEELEVLKGWNEKTASYVHGIGLNVDNVQSPTRSVKDVRKEFNVLDSEKLIVSVGELDDNKNHVAAIRALALLRHRDFKYIVCGVGKNKESLMAEAINLGLSDNVILAGFRSDIPEILNAADVFVFPSFHEGLPVSALEAMAAGLPIICSEIRGNVDIINDGDNGFLFNPYEPMSLKDKLQLLWDDKVLRESMGAKNKEIIKNYSLEAVTKELKQIYQLQ